MTTLPVILSAGFVPLIKGDDTVRAGQIIAKKIFYKECIINIANEFFVSTEKARKYLRKKPGDKINVGDVLAVKKKFLGLSVRKVISRVEGVISRYERDSGNLFITLGEEEEVVQIVSPVDGIITLCDNDKIVIGTEKDVYKGRKGAGNAGQGEVFVLEDAFLQNGSEQKESEISLYYALDSRAVGKIIVGRNFQRDLLIKSIGMGAIGVIGTEIRNEDIDYVSNRRMNVPLIEVDNDTIEKVIKWKGKKIYLNSPEKLLVLLHA